MLLISRRDGSVDQFELETEDGLREFRSLSSDPSWHPNVTGASLVGPGHRADLPLPKKLGPVTYDAENLKNKDGKLVAERVSASAGDVYVTLTMYLNGSSGRFRVDLSKPGKRRWRSY